MEEAVRRAVLWHQGQLPPGENLSCYDMHVAGPKLPPEGGMPTRFHTYACLFPEKGLYIAMNTGAWPGCSISAVELRELIAATEAPSEKILDQRRIATTYVGASTASYRWEYAKLVAQHARLPIAFFAVGDTRDSNERVAYLRIVVFAPLAKVIAEFKRAAPQIHLN